MNDLLGNELRQGDAVILGTTNPGSTLRIGVVVSPSVQWGLKEEKRVLVHTLDSNYLKRKTQHTRKQAKGALPENLIKVPPFALPPRILQALSLIVQASQEPSLEDTIREEARYA